MLLHYLKVALRNLLKYPTQSMISMIGLSVGTLCFSICFYCSRFIESTDTSFQHYKRLAEVHIHHGEDFYPGTPATLDEKLKSSTKSKRFRGLSTWTNATITCRLTIGKSCLIRST